MNKITLISAIILLCCTTGCGGGGSSSNKTVKKDTNAKTISLSGTITAGLDGDIRVEVDGSIANIAGTTWDADIELEDDSQTILVELYLDNILVSAQDIEINR